MNSDEMWLLQLWSGAFGATIGAILAAGVAFMVVRLTNNHQGKLSTESLVQQRTLAEAALAAQKVQAAAALEAQKEALSQQLAEQRVEASKGRMIAAVTDMIEAIHQMGIGKPFDRDARLANYRRAYAAAHRWYIEDAGELELAELLSWPQWLYRLAKATDEEGATEKTRNAQVNASSHFQALASKWPNARTDERRELRKQLQGALLMTIAAQAKDAGVTQL
jgi:hypothetical protein